MKKFLLGVIVLICTVSTMSIAASAIPTNYRYYQEQERWNTGDNSKYNIRPNGCGPTAVATVLASKLNKPITPIDIAKLNGYNKKETVIANLIPSAIEWVKINYPNDYRKVLYYDDISVYNDEAKLRSLVKQRNDVIVGHITNHFFAIDCASYNPNTDSVGVVGYDTSSDNEGGPNDHNGAYHMRTIRELIRAQGVIRTKEHPVKNMDYVYVFGSSEASTKFKPDLYTDLDGSHWAYDDIKVMKEAGLISGRPNGSFDPNATITAEEFLALLSRIVDKKGFTKASGSVYLENEMSSYWSKNDYIVLARILGKISGEKDRLGRNEITKTLAQIDGWSIGIASPTINQAVLYNYKSPITRERAAYIMGAFGFEGKTTVKKGNYNDWNKVNDEYKKRINGLIDAGIFKGVGGANGTLSVNPKGLLTRAEAAALLNRLDAKL